jgi:hypothetical protein
MPQCGIFFLTLLRSNVNAEEPFVSPQLLFYLLIIGRFTSILFKRYAMNRPFFSALYKYSLPKPQKKIEPGKKTGR